MNLYRVSDYLVQLLENWQGAIGNIAQDHTPFANGYEPTLGVCADNALQRSLEDEKQGQVYGWLIFDDYGTGRRGVIAHVVNHHPIDEARYLDSTPIQSQRLAFIPDPQPAQTWIEMMNCLDRRGLPILDLERLLAPPAPQDP